MATVFSPRPFISWLCPPWEHESPRCCALCTAGANRLSIHSLAAVKLRIEKHSGFAETTLNPLVNEGVSPCCTWTTEGFEPNNLPFALCALRNELPPPRNSAHGRRRLVTMLLYAIQQVGFEISAFVLRLAFVPFLVHSAGVGGFGFNLAYRRLPESSF